MTRLVAITGATGFIGWHVARRFREQGWQVRALVRPESRGAVPDGVERRSTRFERSPLGDAMHGAQLVVHLAAAIKARSPEDFARANVALTADVARAAAGAGARLVHISSLAVTGPGQVTNPPGEDDPPRPIGDYGESKRQSEMVVRGIAGLEWTILRPTLVYGPRDRLFLPIFRLGRRGIFVVPNSTASYNAVHVEDVARAIELAGTCPGAPGQTFFVGYPGHVTTTEMLAALAAIFHKPFRPIHIPHAMLRAVAEAGSLVSRLGLSFPLDRDRLRDIDTTGFVCRVDRARERLGFSAAIGLAEGFAATAEWYRRKGWL